MFADYRVPQALVYLGLLKYDDILMSTLKDHPHLPSGSDEEVEIRGCSIEAVEKLKTFLGDQTPAYIIDFALWDYAKDNSDKMAHIPIHKTKGIFY